MRLVEAFAASRLVDHELLLAGPDDGAAREVRDAIDRTKTSDRVRLLGLVGDGDIRRLIAGADALAYISLDEGFGVPPLEAMAVGVPVVASDIPALRETAGGGGAILVSPADVEQIAEALRRAVNDVGLRARARLEGPVHARGYRWSATARQVRLALEQAAA